MSEDKQGHCLSFRKFRNSPSVCIHQSRRRDRESSILEQLPKHGFEHVEVVEAVEGLELDIDKVDLSLRARVSLNEPRKSWTTIHSKHEVGQYLSHVHQWERMLRDDIPCMKVFQDNVWFRYADVAKLSHTWEEVPSDADIVFLCDLKVASRHLQPISSTNKFLKVSGPFSHLTGYFITKAGAYKLCRKAKPFPIDVRADSYISYCAQNAHVKLQCYVMTHPICARSAAPADSQEMCIPCEMERFNDHGSAGAWTMVAIAGLCVGLALMAGAYARCRQRKSEGLQCDSKLICSAANKLRK
jgi:GR25 family glycosyltransferase involved in LPS biosynthesis